MEKDFEPSVADHSDMYIGCFERYGWDQIKYLVNSLDRSGFTGRKVMIVLGADKATLEKLASKGWKAVPFGKRDAREQVDLPVHVLRFFYISYLLERLPENQKPDYVITTDVRDVIFQKDPFAALRNYVRSHPSLVLIASSESMRYRDEPWGNQNLLETFGSFVYEKYKNCEIYNVGVLAGTLQAIQELSQTIFELSISREKKIVDQAVFNFIVHQKTFSSNILKLPSEAGWAAQLGTTADPEKKTSFAPFLMEPAPIMKQAGQDHKVFTSDGSTEFFIVHQYDRIPEWKQLLEAQYDDKCGMGPDHIIEVRAGATSPCNNILGPCEGTLLLPNLSNRARSGENAFCRVATSALLKARAIFPARVLAAIRRASNALRCF